MQDVGRTIYPALSELEALYRYYALRSSQVHKAFRDVMGDRIIPVLGGQTAFHYNVETILDEYINKQKAPTPHLALNGYIGLNVKDKSLGVDGMLRALREQEIPALVKLLEENKTITDKYKVPIDIYEGGLHLVGQGMDVFDKDLTRMYIAVNRDPRIGDICKQLIIACAPYVKEFCWFAYVDPYSMYGSWGAKEYQVQDDAPKWKALTEPIIIPPVIRDSVTDDLIMYWRTANSNYQGLQVAADRARATLDKARENLKKDLDANGAYIFEGRVYFLQDDAIMSVPLRSQP
jgi:hypothetical protein